MNYRQRKRLKEFWEPIAPTEPVELSPPEVLQSIITTLEEPEVEEEKTEAELLRVITLTERDYAALQSLVLKYGSGTGYGTSISVHARVAIADAEYLWPKQRGDAR